MASSIIYYYDNGFTECGRFWEEKRISNFTQYAFHTIWTWRHANYDILRANYEERHICSNKNPSDPIQLRRETKAVYEESTKSIEKRRSKVILRINQHDTWCNSHPFKIKLNDHWIKSKLKGSIERDFFVFIIFPKIVYILGQKS